MSTQLSLKTRDGKKNRGRIGREGNKLNTYDDVFEDVMSYFTGDTRKDIKDFDSKESLITAIRRWDDDRGKNFNQTLLNEFKETDLLTREFADIDETIEKAVKVEVRRPIKSRIKDESKTAKRLRQMKNPQFRQWLRNPERTDLKGIDNKNKKFIREFTDERIRTYRNKGNQVRIYKRGRTRIPFVVKKDRNGHQYSFNILNGRRIPKRILASKKP